jgi:hypothetical protein
MAIITPTSTTPNPYYLVDPVTYVENAANVVVYTSDVENAEVIGSGMSAALKMVAASVNENIGGVTMAADNVFTLTNVNVRGAVYGGAIASSTPSAGTSKNPKIASKYIEGLHAVVYGNTSVTIENGNYGNVFGGGAGYGSVVTGDSEVNWMGNSVGTIYGGGDIGSVVEGDANVNIGTLYGNIHAIYIDSHVGSYNGYKNGGRISNIYGGGKNSTVLGDTNVTFTSDAALINFTGTVYGSGDGKNSIVQGDRNLIFDNYSNDFKATIKDFTHIEFVGATSVVMKKAQNYTIVGATYEFAINDDSLKNTKAMLVWDMNVRLNNIVVTIGTGSESIEPQMLDMGAEIELISSKYFVKDSSFNSNNVLVLNDEGNKVSDFLYTITYEKYDKKTKEGGTVTLEYKGTANLILDGTYYGKIVLTGRSDEVNIIAGGNLVGGLDAAGGNDIVNVQTGATVNGTISLGAGNDTICIQVGATLNGCIDLGSGDDHMVLAAGAVVNCDVALGTGKNDVTVQNNAMITGTIRFSDGSVNEKVTNKITINGGAVANFDGGNAYTDNTLVVTGSRILLPILGEFAVGGGIGYYQSIIPNSIDLSGVVSGNPLDLHLTIDQENWILANIFVAQDLNLGASNDNVTFNSYAQVVNINLGAGDDKLTLNEEAIISGDINLGSGDNVLVINCGNVWDGKLIENLDSTVVIVAGTSMELDGYNLGLGSTNNVLVVTKGAILELEGNSMGRFLTENNDDIYLCQNAIVKFEDFACHTEYIQNYTGYLTVEGNLEVWAEPTTIPELVTPYYKITTPGGVVNSEIETEGDFVVTKGAHVTNSLVSVEEDFIVEATATVNASEIRVGGDAIIDGTVTGGILDVEGIIETHLIGVSGTENIFAETSVGGNLYVDGGITGATVFVDGDAYIDGTLTNSFIKVDQTFLMTYTEDSFGVMDVVDVDRVGGNLDIDGVVTGSTLLVDETAIITGVVTGSTLTAEEVVFDAEGVIFTGSLTAEEVKFNFNFSSPTLVISTEEVKLEENITVTVSRLSNMENGVAEEIDYDLEENSALVELDRTMEPDVLTVGLVTVGDISAFADPEGYVFDFSKFKNEAGENIPNISLRGEVDADIILNGNRVYFDGGRRQGGDQLHGTVTLNGANVFVINTDSFFDWQQFKLVDQESSLGFDISTGKLVAIDGYMGSDPVTTVIDHTAFELNSQVVIGKTAYIHDWKDTAWERLYDLNETQEEVDEFRADIVRAPNALLVNLHVTAGATIWGGISLNNLDNELVIKGGVVINGGVNYYDYATIMTLAGNDTVTIGELSAPGVAADDMRTTINGRIDTGATMVEGAAADGITYTNDDDTMTLINTDVNAAVNQDISAISMGWGNDELNIVATSHINGNIELGDGNDDVSILGASIVDGNISLGEGHDDVLVEDSIVNGTVDLGNGYNDMAVIDSTISAVTDTSDDAIVGGADGDDVFIMASTINGDIELGDGDNELVIMAGTTQYGYAQDVSSTVNGDISLGDDDDEVRIIGSTLNGSIDLGDGYNELAIINSTIGLELVVDSFFGRGFNDAILGGDDSNDIYISASTVNGDIEIEGLYNDLDIKDASIVNGDIAIGNVDYYSYRSADVESESFFINTLDISNSTVNGDIDLGDVYVELIGEGVVYDEDYNVYMSNNVEIVTSTVTGDITFGDVIVGVTGEVDLFDVDEVFVGNSALIVDSTVSGDISFGDVVIVGMTADSVFDGNGDQFALGNTAVILSSTVGNISFGDVVSVNDNYIDGYLGIGNVAVLAGSTAGDISFGDVLVLDDLDVDDGGLGIGNMAAIVASNVGDITFEDVTINGDIGIGDEGILQSHSDDEVTTGEEIVVGNMAVIAASTTGNIIFDDVTITDDVNIDINFTEGIIGIGNMALVAESTVNGSLIFDDVNIGEDDGTIGITGTISDSIVGIGNMAVLSNTTITDDLVFGNVNLGDVSAQGVTADDDVILVMGNLAVIDGDVQVQGNLLMGKDLTTDETDLNAILLSETGHLTVGNSLTFAENGNIAMIGNGNAIITHEYITEYELGDNETMIVDGISNEITANALIMVSDNADDYDVVKSTISGVGNGNLISWGVEAEVNGLYNPDGGTFQDGLHKISRLELGTVGMTLTAPIMMVTDDVDGYNLLNMDYELDADEEGDILVTGNANISVIGDIAMLGLNNELSANIVLDVGNQAVIDLQDNTVNLLIDGNITMIADEFEDQIMALDGVGYSGSNEITLGLIVEGATLSNFDASENVSMSENGEIIGNNDNYNVTVIGDIVMGGIGVTNTMTIDKNVTITGDIIMGLVNGGPMEDTNITGDDLAFLNTLTVNDPGTFTMNGTIVLTARSNDVYFYGEGDVTGLVSIYGGSNYLYVGEDVTINDIVSFGGIYDADLIGIEGYLIQPNTDNEIEIYGKVKGIDTSLDLNAPIGTINASNDDIDIYGSVSPAGITTGNGNDDIDIHGGLVAGNIIMGDRASGAEGTNDLYIEAVLPEVEPVVTAAGLGGAATVGGNIVMETTTTNRLEMEGLVLTDFSDMETPETVYRATISGNVLMNAYQGATGGTGGTNTVFLGDGFHEGATTIVGSVTMNAGAGNTMSVDTGWLYDFDQATSVAFASYDAASYIMQNVAMKTEGDNTLEVEHGTFVIGFTGAGDGLSMTQNLNAIGSTGGDNLIDVDDEARLVMYSDVRMGNTVVDLVGGVYNYFNVTIDASTNIETYHFIWSVDVSATVFDTAENTIRVDGKMFASDIVMYASDNDIFLTGPAMAPWTVVTAADAGIMTSPGVTGAIMDVDDITMNGWTNTIKVDGQTGFASFHSDDILMRWGAGVTLGTSLTATTNIVQNGDESHNGNTLFRSGSIEMYASSQNVLDVFGYMNADSSVNTKSTVDGGVTMMALAIAGTDIGRNLARFEDADVTGNVFMAAAGLSGANELDLVGTFLGGTYADVESNITGDVTMITAVGVNGDNEATIIYGNVGITSGGGQINMLAGISGANDLYVEGGITHTSDIGHGIFMASVFENNELDLINATVGAYSADGITMGAGTNNWAKITASTVYGSISQSAGTTNYLGIDPSTVTGNVTMTSALGGGITCSEGWTMDGGNLLELFGATAGSALTNNVIQSGIGGNVVMDANIAGSTLAYGANLAEIWLAGITGSLNMTSVYGVNGGNVLDLEGGIGAIGGTGTIVESYIGGLTMTSSGVTAGATGGDNEAYIDLANVNGNVVMTAGGTGADNILEVTGGVNGFGVTYTSDIAGGVNMTSAAGSNGLTFAHATVGAGITMTANQGINLAIINDSVITGPISQSGIANILWIDPSTVNGSVGMTGGLNTFVLEDSNVIGNVSMFSNGLGNILGMFDSGVTGGNVTMTSSIGGNAFGFGDTGAHYNPAGVESFPVIPDFGFSHIYGNVSMTAGITGATGGDNRMAQFGTINGSVVMGATADGDNELGIGGSASGGVTLTSVITNGLSMTTVTGENTLVVAPYASISGGVTMWTGITGHSDVRVYATSSIEGGIVTGNGNDDFWIGGSVTGGLSSGIGNDDLTVYAGATVGGDINMGAGSNTIVLDSGLMPFYGTGATFTVSDINTDGATGTVGITGTVGTETMIISDGFGTVGSTMTVNSSVETIVFNELNTEVYGTLDTVNGTVGVTGTINVFDVSGATFGTLIDANNSTSWDLMDQGGITGGFEIYANDGMTGGHEVTLVDNYTNLDLTAWTDHNAITLNIVGDDNNPVTLTWNGTAYTGTDPEGAGTRTWTLDDADSKTSLKLSVAFTATP